MEAEEEPAAGVGAAEARGEEVVGEEGAMDFPAQDAEECGRLRLRGGKEQPRQLRRGLLMDRDEVPVGADGAERGAVGAAGEAREDVADEPQGKARPDGHWRWSRNLENGAVVGGEFGEQSKGEKTV